MASPFDTLAAVEAIENAGADRKLAKAIASQMRIASDVGGPSAYRQLNVTVGALKAELSALETRLTWRLVSAMVVVNTLLVAAIKLIP